MLLVTEVSPVCCSFLSLISKCSPQNSLLRHSQFIFFSQRMRQCLISIRNHTLLCSLISTFVHMRRGGLNGSINILRLQSARHFYVNIIQFVAVVPKYFFTFLKELLHIKHSLHVYLRAYVHAELHNCWVKWLDLANIREQLNSASVPCFYALPCRNARTTTINSFVANSFTSSRCLKQAYRVTSQACSEL